MTGTQSYYYPLHIQSINELVKRPASLFTQSDWIPSLTGTQSDWMTGQTGTQSDCTGASLFITLRPTLTPQPKHFSFLN